MIKHRESTLNGPPNCPKNRYHLSRQFAQSNVTHFTSPKIRSHAQ